MSELGEMVVKVGQTGEQDRKTESLEKPGAGR